MRSKGPLRPVVVGAAIAACVVGVAVLRASDRRSDIPPAAWRHDEGGFTIAFPAPWKSADDDEVLAALPMGVPVQGSTYRRATGGLLVPRFVTAHAYSLGEIAFTRDALTSLINWVGGPVMPLSVDHAGRGVRIATYRFEDRGEELTQAAIVFRGRSALTYMIGVTGRREDEAVVMAEARRVADAIRHDVQPLLDGEPLLAQVFDISMNVLEATRGMTLRTVERRDSARWAFTSMELSEATSLEQCRAGAVFNAGFGLPRLPVREAVSYFETVLTCPSSRVVLGFSMASLEPTLRQFDRDGALVYEATLDRGVTPRERSFWIVNGSRVSATSNGTILRVPSR